MTTTAPTTTAPTTTAPTTTAPTTTAPTRPQVHSSDVPATPRAAAEDLIRHYVHRGDTEEHLRYGHMGKWSNCYKASIGGWADMGDDNRKDFPPTKIVVHMIGDTPLVPPAVFSMHEVYESLKREIDGSPRQGALL